MKVPSASTAELDVLHLAAAVRERHHVIAAGRRPTCTGRPSEAAAAATTEYSAWMPALPPNPPPTCGVTTRTVVRSIAERAGELTVEAVRHLGRGPERQPAVGVGLGRAAVGLHRHDGHALVDVAAAHDDVAGAGEPVDRRGRC